MLDSKKVEEAAMEFVAELIGMVKTNIKRFCKNNIEKLTKDWHGDFYLMLRSKHMVTGNKVAYFYRLQV